MTNLSNDQSDDQEPSTISNDVDGVERTLTAYMKYSSSGVPQIWVARSSDGVSVQLPLATANGVSLDQTGDPATAENPYDVAGIAPDRMYVSGTSYDSAQHAWTQVSVWSTDTGGQPADPYDPNPDRRETWHAPVAVGLQASGPGNYLLDKPAIAVSSHWATRGYVYVVAARVPFCQCGPVTTFPLYRSTDGGRTFTLVADISSDLTPGGATTSYSWAPQIVVDQSRGNVYVFWLDYGQNVLRVVRYSEWNNVLTAVNGSPLSTENLLGPPHSSQICTGPFCLIARSTIAARANWATNELVVAWHSNSGASSPTQVNVRTYSLSQYAWTSNSATINFSGSQWHPALDFDEYGGYLVSYYDRREDPNDILYKLYFTKLSPQLVVTDSDVSVSTTSSDPRRFNGDAFQIGEYQDIWSWNGHWNSSFVYITNFVEDVYSSVVQP